MSYLPLQPHLKSYCGSKPDMRDRVADGGLNKAMPHRNRGARRFNGD
jgi:hypothetical protein